MAIFHQLTSPFLALVIHIAIVVITSLGIRYSKRILIAWICDRHKLPLLLLVERHDSSACPAFDLGCVTPRYGICGRRGTHLQPCHR